MYESLLNSEESHHSSEPKYANLFLTRGILNGFCQSSKSVYSYGMSENLFATLIKGRVDFMQGCVMLLTVVNLQGHVLISSFVYC